MIAFFDLSGTEREGELRTDISRGLGFEPGMNHLAFHSIYTEDPDGIGVEFAVLTRELDSNDAAEALELLNAERPVRSGPPKAVKMHKAPVRARG